MWHISCWSFFTWESFWYLQQKISYDVISETWYLRCFWATRGCNGLNRIFKIQFVLKSDVVRKEIGQIVRFDQVFHEKVNFRFLFNPLQPKHFSKIRRNSVSNLGLQMTIKWPKMMQMSWNKDRNVANVMLIICHRRNFLISSTENKLWRHHWNMVFALLLGNTGL